MVRLLELRDKELLAASKAAAAAKEANKPVTSSSNEKEETITVLRMGVQSGGCSGLSYKMDFTSLSEISPDDVVDKWQPLGSAGGCSIWCVVEPKSMLYLYGMNLEYSDELIGGGFKFNNPNANDSCGCGKSFGV
jgi:iron-sulfur cluster assembly accessory protein